MYSIEMLIYTWGYAGYKMYDTMYYVVCVLVVCRDYDERLQQRKRKASKKVIQMTIGESR